MKVTPGSFLFLVLGLGGEGGGVVKERKGIGKPNWINNIIKKKELFGKSF